MLIDDLLKRPSSSLIRALNGGFPGWAPTDHLLADLWLLTISAHSEGNSRVEDHPVRAAMEERARTAAKLARVIELRAEFERRKRRYSNEIRQEAV
ncbi:hypothetical protein VXD82_01955 [Mycobacteroides chelonae]|uniref:hypothetical protein n=1 Tax=Mycobacteroides chelonae TaxID=1774 RepID=UPI003204B748